LVGPTECRTNGGIDGTERKKTMIEEIGTHANTTKGGEPRGPSEVKFKCPKCGYSIAKYPCWNPKCRYKPGDFDKQAMGRRGRRRRRGHPPPMQRGESPSDYVERMLEVIALIKRHVEKGDLLEWAANVVRYESELDREPMKDTKFLQAVDAYRSKKLTEV
jgi:hypothetical protein